MIFLLLIHVLLQYYPANYLLPNGTNVGGQWCGWTCYETGVLGGVNVSNSVSPIAAVTTDINNALPWYWPIIPFIIYILMMVWYDDSPQRGKLYMIAAIVFVISIFMVFGGYLPDAIFNFFVFIIAFITTRLFKGT